MPGDDQHASGSPAALKFRRQAISWSRYDDIAQKIVQAEMRSLMAMVFLLQSN
jgi:hypothetical protein